MSDFVMGSVPVEEMFAGIPWFNAAAFAAPTPWAWGNSSRNMLLGPGAWNWDIALSKNFQVQDPVRLQVRADFLDAFNHFNLDNPTATIADTPDGGTPNALSGLITGGSGSRVVQVGARLSF